MTEAERSPNHYDHIIVGGGIAGSSLAFELSKYSDNVLLLDADHTGKATNAGAGIISGATTFSDHHDLYSLVREASKYYPQFVRRIENFTDVSTSYTQSEQVITLYDKDHEPLFDTKITQILNRQKDYEYPDDGTIFEISVEEFNQRYPTLSTARRALVYTSAAQIDGRQLNKAIRSAASQIGVDIKQQEVTKLRVQPNNRSVVTSTGEMYSADNIIIAGGAWSTTFEKQLDYKINIFPQRGQIIHLTLDNSVSNLPIIITMNDFYSLSRSKSEIIVGATRESDSGFNAVNTVEGVLQILQNAIKQIPDLRKAQIKEIRVGLRPYSEDKLPFVGNVPGYDHIWLLTGHGPLGLTAGPYTAKLLAEKMNGMEVDELKPFDPSRNIQT